MRADGWRFVVVVVGEGCVFAGGGQERDPGSRKEFVAFGLRINSAVLAGESSKVHQVCRRWQLRVHRQWIVFELVADVMIAVVSSGRSGVF